MVTEKKVRILVGADNTEKAIKLLIEEAISNQGITEYLDGDFINEWPYDESCHLLDNESGSHIKVARIGGRRTPFRNADHISVRYKTLLLR